MTQNINVENMTDDDVLTYTRKKRIELADTLTKSGVPTEKESASILLQTLDGLDRSSLTRMKIKVDEEANKSNTAAASIISEILSSISHKAYQYEGIARREVPTLPDSIPDPEIVEGELETNPQQMDYESFTKQFDQDES